MVVETTIRAGAPRFNKFHDQRASVSSVHLRCTVTFEHASRRLKGRGAAFPDRVRSELQQKPWSTSDEVRPLHDPSILLRADDTLRAVRDMFAAAPRLRDVDLSTANWWGGEDTPRRVAAWLHEQGSKWLDVPAGERPRIRFEVEARLQVKLVFNEPRAVLQRCVEVAMQTVPPESDEECRICFDEFKNDAKSGPVNLPCSHAYHRHCMLTWLDSGKTCPTCRYDLSGMVAAPWTSPQTCNNITAVHLRRLFQPASYSLRFG